MLRILKSGNWPRRAITTERVASGRTLMPEVERAIDAAWAAAARPGIHLFDGPMCRLESFVASAESLHLRWSPTRYRIFLGTNMVHPEFADSFGPGVMGNPIGLSVAIVTDDGQLLLGRRNQSVAYYPGRVHPVAGCLEPTDDSPHAGIRRELVEELNLPMETIRSLRCIGLAEDASLRQMEIVFSAEVAYTADEVAASVDAAEHHGLWRSSATAQGIAAALTDVSGYTPVAVSTLLLEGRLRFGLDWYHQTARSLRERTNLSYDEC